MERGKEQAFIFKGGRYSSSRITARRFLLKCSLVWLPPPPLLFLATSRVCIPVAFWFRQRVWATGGQRACICVPTTQSICTHSCLCMLTQKRDRTSIKFSVFTHAAKLQTIFHLQNTQWHHQMSHPFHLLLLLSVAAASALPNGFSNAGTRFLSRLDRHFPLCLEMRIRPWVVRCDGVVERFRIQSRSIFPELVWKGQMWDLYMYFSTCGQTKWAKSNWNTIILLCSGLCICSFWGAFSHWAYTTLWVRMGYCNGLF